MFSGAAANSTRELLASASLGGSVVESAASALSILRTVALVLLLATLLLVALVALLSASLSLKRRRAGAYARAWQQQAVSSTADIMLARQLHGMELRAARHFTRPSCCCVRAPATCVSRRQRRQRRAA